MLLFTSVLLQLGYLERKKKAVRTLMIHVNKSPFNLVLATDQVNTLELFSSPMYLLVGPGANGQAYNSSPGDSLRLHHFQYLQILAHLGAVSLTYVKKS